MKKLKKESHKMLCLAPRPVAFDCRYDPLSYARNFDGGDDSHLPYAFASRTAKGGRSKFRSLSPDPDLSLSLSGTPIGAPPSSRGSNPPSPPAPSPNGDRFQIMLSGTDLGKDRVRVRDLRKWRENSD
ncbi:uncharacterized protein A4U43_C06F1210 [Asparagus officinalis]|uniref:Uncharacterized protein n=1 Tax=Asparagus officinalis TaxID=4686 RepID=A0A5P1EMN1_ASPOF|nr:uncharacterized protein A4U43_C06F1210 [Asparagus officinalis]